MTAKCAYCGKDYDGRFELDHKDPICQGGKTEPDNMVYACRSCNRKKHGRSVDEFREHIREDTAGRIWDAANKFNQYQNTWTEDQRKKFNDSLNNIMGLVDGADSDIVFYMDGKNG